MAWIYLFVAGAFEIVWAVAMKQSDGFTRPVPVAVMIAGMLLSVWFLTLAMKSLPLGTSYAIWTGIGAVGAFVVGIVMLGEQLSVARVVAACLIVSGMILMMLKTP